MALLGHSDVMVLIKLIRYTFMSMKMLGQMQGWVQTRSYIRMCIGIYTFCVFVLILEILNVHAFVFDSCPLLASICKYNQIHVRCVYQQKAKHSLTSYDWLNGQNRMMFTHMLGLVLGRHCQHCDNWPTVKLLSIIGSNE